MTRALKTKIIILQASLYNGHVPMFIFETAVAARGDWRNKMASFVSLHLICAFPRSFQYALVQYSSVNENSARVQSNWILKRQLHYGTTVYTTHRRNYKFTFNHTHLVPFCFPSAPTLSALSFFLHHGQQGAEEKTMEKLILNMIQERR